MIAGGTTIDVLINALEQRGVVRTPGRAQPGGAVGRHRELPRRRRISRSRSRRRRQQPDHGRIEALRRRPRLHADRAARRPDQSEDRARGQPARSQHAVSIGAGLPPIPALIVRRAATTIELRDGQSFMIGGLLQNEARPRQEQMPWLGRLPVLGAAVLAAGPTRRTRPISPSSSRRAWCGRRGPATSSRRRSTTPCRPTTRTSS